MKRSITICVCLLLFLYSCEKKQEIEVIDTDTPTESINTNSKGALITKFEPAFGLANGLYNRPGPYQVSTTGTRLDCTGLAGTIQRVLHLYDSSILA